MNTQETDINLTGMNVNEADELLIDNISSGPTQKPFVTNDDNMDKNM